MGRNVLRKRRRRIKMEKDKAGEKIKLEKR
jgi:hypothetical protein